MIAQQGGGAYHFHQQECISSAMRNEMVIECQHAYQKYLSLDHSKKVNQRKSENFIWPIQNSSTYPGYEVYAVSGGVDHNPVFSATNDLSTLKDYNCGTRTYDTGNYNHTGTDIALWPFHWEMMDKEYAEVVAVKSGTIILKKDGIYDRSCAFCTNCDWNAVYVLHDDNTVTIYGHLKEGSLTNKNEFDEVSQGEYLGIVGSSGNSTGPHLHFEVTDINGFIIDPYEGSCNSTTTTSLWADQKPYLEPTINRLMTATKAPKFGACPQDDEQSYEATTFYPGDKVIYAAYFHDQTQSSFSNFKVTYPNGSAYKLFSHISPESYLASYWYWEFDLPQDAPSGTYTFSCKYEGQAREVKFEVVSSTATSDLNVARKEVYFEAGFLKNGNPNVNYSIEVYNTLGQLTMRGILNENLNIAHLQKGGYIVKLKSKEKDSILKIVKVD